MVNPHSGEILTVLKSPDIEENIFTTHLNNKKEIRDFTMGKFIK